MSKKQKEAVSMVVGEIAGQASHRFNSALNRTEWLKSITDAEEKKATSNQSQIPMLIRQVPSMLPNTKDLKTCYEPSVVSIGPYHYNCDTRLHQVEELKLIIAKQFVGQLTEIKDVGIFFNEFEDEFEMIRNPSIKDMYDKNVTQHINDEEFMRMMFLDGCFILYFIYCIHFYKIKRMGLKNHFLASLVQEDLFLVENQLPFQVLRVLMRLSYFNFFGNNGMNLLVKFADEMNSCRVPIWMRDQPVPNNDPLHLLDLLWVNLLGQSDCINMWPFTEIPNKRHLFHGVKELTAAGIHFRPNSTGSLRDIKFRSCGIYGRLTLPRITIERSTRQMFLNLIAHEACMNNSEKFGFTSYICFLDLLIDHDEDVKALRNAGILVNYLDSDEKVANLFNEIAVDLLPVKDAYSEVKLQMLDYLGAKRKVKMASWVVEVIRDHFKSPWTIIALSAGIIVICIAFVQTYYTVFPRSK